MSAVKKVVDYLWYNPTRKDKKLANALAKEWGEKEQEVKDLTAQIGVLSKHNAEFRDFTNDFIKFAKEIQSIEYDGDINLGHLEMEAHHILGYEYDGDREDNK